MSKKDAGRILNTERILQIEKAILSDITDKVFNKTDSVIW